MKIQLESPLGDNSVLKNAILSKVAKTLRKVPGIRLVDHSTVSRKIFAVWVGNTDVFVDITVDQKLRITIMTENSTTIAPTREINKTFSEQKIENVLNELLVELLTHAR